MKLKKIAAAIAATAAAVSMMAVNVSATNWANASYADDDPNTVKIISTDEDKVVFGATGDGIAMKCRVVAGDLVAAEDLAKVKSITWTVTYDVSAAKEFVWLGGGTYAAFKNSSTQYSINATYDELSNPVSYEGQTLTFDDSVKFLLAKEVLTADSELVFMDWSNTNLASNGITMTVSNLKFFDDKGNEIAQLPYGGAVAAPAETEAAPEETTAAPEETTAAPAETEAPAADADEEVAVDDVDEDAAPVETEAPAPVEAAPVETAAPAPAADTTTTPAATGNVAVASIVAVMAVAGAAAIVAKKRK